MELKIVVLVHLLGYVEKLAVFLEFFFNHPNGFSAFCFFPADGSGTIMVRGCALDSGTLTTDTELIRMSHCGSFFFDDK